MKLRFESYRKNIGNVLLDIASRNERLVVLDADTGRSTGSLVFGKNMKQRYINIGISEQDLIGTAAGLAIAGMKPVAMAFAMFMMRAVEQIRNTIARDRLDVKLIATHAGLSAHFDGSSHQALEDIAFMRAIPGMTVVSPADVVSMRGIVEEAVDMKGPVYIRLGRDNAVPVYDEWSHRIGNAVVLRDCVDACIIAIGPMVGVSVEAARLLEEEHGIKTGVIDMHTVKPIDTMAVRRAFSTSLVATVEEHNIHGGLAGAVAEAALENGVRGRLVRIGVRDTFGTSARSYNDLLEAYGLTPASIAEAIARSFSSIRV